MQGYQRIFTAGRGSFFVCVLSLGLSLSATPLAEAGPPAAAPSGMSQEDEDQLLQNSIRQAKEQLALGNPADALKRLQSAYASVPTPALLWPIAELHRRLEQPIEGLATLQKYVEQVPPHKMPRGQQMPQVEHLQEQMRKQIARLQIFATADASVSIDGKDVDAAGLANPVEVNPGRHRVETRQGTRTLAREIRVIPAQTLLLDMRLPALLPIDSLPQQEASAAASRSRHPLRTAYWVMSGVGLAGILSGSILWGLDGLQRCPQAPRCPQELDGKPPGVGLFSVGLGLTAGAVVIGLIDYSSSKQKTRPLLLGRL